MADGGKRKGGRLEKELGRRRRRRRKEKYHGRKEEGEVKGESGTAARALLTLRRIFASPRSVYSRSGGRRRRRRRRALIE